MKDEDRIEIRLLGRLYVRRGDGSVVDASEWRTGKTLDLLRLLALEADHPVRIASLLDKLWPDVDESRGRASLRTAASQIRRTLGSDCIDRQLGGLVLRNTWVDVSAFRALATEARSCLRAREFARVVALAREAEGLYLKDFDAHDDGSAWALEVRESLASARRELLADAAESAVELHWVRDGIDLAWRAIEADPCSERPHRALMQAYAALGETEQALRAFDHCRQMLADELGADPSAQTRAVHMQVLSGYVDVGTVGHVFVGREAEITAMSTEIEQSLSRGPQLVCVVGQQGSGRDALLAEATARVAAKCVWPNLANGATLPSKRDLEELVGLGEPVVVVLGSIDRVDARAATEFKRVLSAFGDSPLTVAAPVSAEAAQVFEAKLGPSVRTLHVDALTGEDLQTLATTLLSGPVTPALVEALRQGTRGLAGHAVATLRQWSSRGQVISTAGGLELVPAGADVDTEFELGSVIRRVLERLTPEEMTVIHLVALINAPVTPETLVRLVESENNDPADVRRTLDTLVDLGALRHEGQGYLFRHPVMRDATESWIRPTRRRLLQRHIASRLEEKASLLTLDAEMSEELFAMAASAVPQQRGWGEALEDQIRRSLAASFPGWNFDISLSVSEMAETAAV